MLFNILNLLVECSVIIYLNQWLDISSSCFSHRHGHQSSGTREYSMVLIHSGLADRRLDSIVYLYRY